MNPVEVQRRTVSHFKGLFKTFKMRYSTFLYSYWIGLHFMLTSFDEFFETGNFSLNSYSVHCAVANLCIKISFVSYSYSDNKTTMQVGGRILTVSSKAMDGNKSQYGNQFD